MQLLYAVVALGVLVSCGHAAEDDRNPIRVDLDVVNTMNITFKPQSEDAILSIVMFNASDKTNAFVKNIIGHKNGKLCVISFATGTIAAQVKSLLVDGGAPQMTPDDLENKRHILATPNVPSLMEKYAWLPLPTSITNETQFVRLVDSCKDSAGNMKWNDLNKEYKISLVKKNSFWQLDLNGEAAESEKDAIGFPIGNKPRYPFLVAVRSGIAVDEIKIGLSESSKKVTGYPPTGKWQIKAEVYYGTNMTVPFIPVERDGILSILMHHPNSETYAVTHNFIGERVGKLCVANYWSRKRRFSLTPFNTRPWNMTHDEKIKKDTMKHHLGAEGVEKYNFVPESLKGRMAGNLRGFLDGCRMTGDITWQTIGKEFKVTITSEDNNIVFRLVGDDSNSNQLEMFTMPATPGRYYDFIFAADKGMSLGDVTIDPAY